MLLRMVARVARDVEAEAYRRLRDLELRLTRRATASRVRARPIACGTPTTAKSTASTSTRGADSATSRQRAQT